MKDKTIIIAEAGVNHNGSMDLAKRLIDVAFDSGADFVKFQTFHVDKLISKETQKADYQLKNLKEGKHSQYEMLKSLELSDKMHFELFDYCYRKGIAFLSTGFDEESIDFLDKIGVSLIKIPSGEITNKPYLQHIGRKGKNVIMSTGMSTLGEIENAFNTLLDEGMRPDQITLLHCNSEYPTAMEDVNLKAMLTLQDAFKVKVGYSDHTLGIEIPIAAVALGASVIEKHFTLDRNMSGPDHKASLLPEELLSMVLAIRNVEKSLSGDGIKKPSLSEVKNIPFARKRIVALTNIKIGEVFSKENLSLKRNNDGLSAEYWDFIIGKKACRNYLNDEGIDFN